MNDYKFGNFLCMLRVKNGMTQADLANKLGVTPAAVSKWENGSSKPRVEVLFQLANLFGVRAEELMSGQYIAAEALDPEAVKQINERYAYLMRVEPYNTASVKWRRMLAWVIDWNIIGFSVIFLTAIVTAVLSTFNVDPQTAALIMMFGILLYPVCFVLRDLIFSGRSPGKRIVGLAVLDRQTGLQAGAGKCALRNLFLFIVHIDAIFMLVSGSSIGDRAAHTVVVVRKSSLNNNERTNQIAEINTYSAPKRVSTKKTVLIVAGIVILILVLIISIVLLALSAAKNTEEYKVAYNYLVESQMFEEAGADESEIWFNQYSLTINSDPASDNVTQTVEIGFYVKGKSFQVICHKQNDIWSVCDGCTKFR